MLCLQFTGSGLIQHRGYSRRMLSHEVVARTEATLRPSSCSLIRQVIIGDYESSRSQLHRQVKARRDGMLRAI